MPPRDPPKSAPAGQAGDDFQQIHGIGAAIGRRLHDAGILTYGDLAALTPEQIAASLVGVAGLSSARVASQDWVGQAGQLAGPATSPLPSEPDQRYASFHIELLLDVDGSVRRTKLRHHQSGTDEAWAGWDEDRLLALLRSHIPFMASLRPAEPADQLSPVTPAAGQAALTAPSGDQPDAAARSGDRQETASMPVSLRSSSLRVERLGLTHGGERSHTWVPGEPTAVGFILRVDRTSAVQADTLDFTADIAASSTLGDNQRWPLGTVQGAVRVGEHLCIELTGQPLPRGLYRPEATVLIYPANHAPDSEPLQGRRASGALIHVA